MHISVVGLGKLGSPLAAVLAYKGNTVVGVDVNANLIRLISAGKAPVWETQLQELIDAGRKRLSATADYETAILGTDVSFILVPTPSSKTGGFSNKFVLAAIEGIGRSLRKKEGYHVVAVTSTVMPGSTGGEIREALELHSGRKVGDDVGLCYNPEFVALGSVIRDLLRPDLILIGESDTRAGDVLEGVYDSVCENTPAVQRMNFVNAELTKMALNTFVTMKISYANMLADITDRLPGADVDVVTAALGKDSRIGSKYLKGALGYGGPCFPRDNIAFGHLARDLGARADIVEAIDRINQYQIERLSDVVQGRLLPGGTVGVLGMSYKPETYVIEESQGVALAKLLADEGYRVVIYDPQAMNNAHAVLGDRVTTAQSADACARTADVLVITVPWEEFRNLRPEALARSDGRVSVIDCWRILPAERFAKVADLVYLGRGSDYVAARAAENKLLQLP